jgi:hypothetical protein
MRQRRVSRQSANAASEASQKPSVGPSKYELQGPTRQPELKRRLQLTGRSDGSQPPVTGGCGELPHRTNPRVCPSRALPCGSA